MTKKHELSDADSCWNKARPAERLFILLERDSAMPYTIRKWVKRRVKIGKTVTLTGSSSKPSPWLTRSRRHYNVLCVYQSRTTPDFN